MNKDKKTFASERPSEAKQWDYSKNDGMTPMQFAPQANKKVWWICENGHSYEKRIADRYNGGGCPYCAGKKVLAGYNDLATICPDIAAQWNYEKNNGITPETVTSASGKKVWWTCDKGHSYEARIDARTLHETGCPYCSGKIAIPGENDLATMYPEIAAEWNYEENGEMSPAMLKPASNQKVWWTCDKGHNYQATAADRTLKGNGCPYCANKKVLAGYNSLADTHPEVLVWWDYEKNEILPTEITAGSHKKIWWTCDKGHSFSTSVYSKTHDKTKCPICSGKQVLSGYNDLLTTHPDIACEWDYEKNKNLTPRDVTAGSNKKVWWTCDKGHSYETYIVQRTTKNSSCPYCSGHRVLPGFNSLADTRPEIASEWDYERNEVTPDDVTAGSSLKAWWKCSCGHSYEASVYLRTRKNIGTGCPYCSNKKVMPGFNDLATTNPEIACEWNYEKNGNLTPRDITAGANRKVWWKCSHGHAWQATAAMRKKTGCPECSKHKKTSQTEQAVFYYVKQYAADAVSGYRIGTHSELDIFIPSLNIAIEYDGSFYHSDIEKDIKKDKWCQENGITLYRIREPECPELDSNSICIYRESTFLNDDLNKVIAELIYKIFNKEVQPNVLAHKNEILANLEWRELENSVASKHPVIASQWHYEKNAPLRPENISSVTHVKYWWYCEECGHEWEATPYLRCSSKTAYGICPNCRNIPENEK